MEKIIEIVTRKEFLIAVAIIIVLLAIFLLNRSHKKKKYLNQLADFEVRYNSLKSIPLSFKLNKAVAIARLDEKAMQVVTRSKDDFDLCQSNLKQISSMLADTEDLIQVRKLKLVKLNIVDIDNLISLAEKQVSSLNDFLDSVLEKESAQRAEVTQLKDEFRTVKAQLHEKSAQLNFCWDMIEVKVSTCEKKFTTFEEWMYASEFEKASVELVHIKESLSEFSMILNELPALLQEARGVVPNMIDEVARLADLENKKGVYLQHLEVGKNLEIIQDTLKEDLNNLKNGNTENIKAHCEDYRIRLNQLHSQLHKESASYNEMSSYRNRAEQLIEQCFELQDYAENISQESMVKFGLTEIMEDIHTQKTKIMNFSELKDKIIAMIDSNAVPSSTIILSLKELIQDGETLLKEYTALKERIESARSDEERAGKQLLKLQLIMNEMQVKIHKHRLPSISNSYHNDMEKAYEYVHCIENLLKETPLNVPFLNSSLNEAIDFIYKLYNNVNNIVGMAIMVENTIVFGNKYRSSYPDIDSELTRAELCYRNGEYTQALTIAIATIEKIFPTTYEQMIKENAQSAS